MKKKYFLIILVITLFQIKTYSQESKIKYSIQGGVNSSNLRGYNPLGDVKFSIAYLFGASFEYKIKDKISLKVDVNYERKVQKTDDKIDLYNPDMTLEGTYTVEITNYSNYIVLPILVKYNFSKYNTFYLKGGPFLGFLINSGTKSDSDVDWLDSGTIKTTKYNKTLDFGMSFGIGKQFKMNGENKIYLEFRDNLGLVNTREAPVYGNGKMMTNSVNLIVGYVIN